MIKKKRIREQCTSWLSTLHSNQPYCRLPKWQDHRNSLVTAFSWCEYSRKTKECGDYKQVASFSSVQKDPWEDMNIKTSANNITSGVDSLRTADEFSIVASRSEMPLLFAGYGVHRPYTNWEKRASLFHVCLLLNWWLVFWNIMWIIWTMIKIGLILTTESINFHSSFRISPLS